MKKLIRGIVDNELNTVQMICLTVGIIVTVVIILNLLDPDLINKY